MQNHTGIKAVVTKMAVQKMTPKKDKRKHVNKYVHNHIRTSEYWIRAASVVQTQALKKQPPSNTLSFNAPIKQTLAKTKSKSDITSRRGVKFHMRKTATSGI